MAKHPILSEPFLMSSFNHFKTMVQWLKDSCITTLCARQPVNLVNTVSSPSYIVLWWAMGPAGHSESRASAKHSRMVWTCWHSEVIPVTISVAHIVFSSKLMSALSTPERGLICELFLCDFLIYIYVCLGTFCGIEERSQVTVIRCKVVCNITRL